MTVVIDGDTGMTTPTGSFTDANGDLEIGVNNLGTATDTRKLTVASNGYAVINLNGDYSNTAGEPGGSAIQLQLDGAGSVDAVVSFINAANTRGDSATAYTGTTGNSMLVGTVSTFPLYLGTNSTVQASISATGDFSFNSGYGSVATAYGCRAWVNFDGTASGTITPRASGNVSSVTKNATGDYTVTFTNAMPDANYAIAFATSKASLASGNTPVPIISNATPLTASAARFVQTYTASTTTGIDALYQTVVIFR